MVDTTAPMSLGAFLAVVGVIITWVMGGIALRKFVIEERRRRRDDEGHLEGLIGKVCKSFTESDSYQLRHDRAMIAVAQSVNDEAFRVRSTSFVFVTIAAHAALFVPSSDNYPDGSWRNYAVYYDDPMDPSDDGYALPCRSNYSFGPASCTSPTNCLARADQTHRAPKCNALPPGTPDWP